MIQGDRLETGYRLLLYYLQGSYHVRLCSLAQLPFLPTHHPLSASIYWSSLDTKTPNPQTLPLPSSMFFHFLPFPSYHFLLKGLVMTLFSSSLMFKLSTVLEPKIKELIIYNLGPHVSPYTVPSTSPSLDHLDQCQPREDSGLLSKLLTDLYLAT